MMLCGMAEIAQRNQIFFRIISGMAAKLLVMNFQVSQ